MTGFTLPETRRLPAFHAPTAKKMWVYPWAFSSSTEGAGVFSLTSTPIFLMKAASFSMASLEIRKAGITWRTTPPKAASFSNRVVGIPARAQK